MSVLRALRHSPRKLIASRPAPHSIGPCAWPRLVTRHRACFLFSRTRTQYRASRGLRRDTRRVMSVGDAGYHQPDRPTTYICNTRSLEHPEYQPCALVCSGSDVPPGPSGKSQVSASNSVRAATMQSKWCVGSSRHRSKPLHSYSRHEMPDRLT